MFCIALMHFAFIQYRTHLRTCVIAVYAEIWHILFIHVFC